MIDFTLSTYKHYLDLIQGHYDRILLFREYFELNQAPDNFCMIRHDIDRRVDNALAVAKMEREMGIRSTFYFRNRPSIFKPEIIRQIEGMGHEIGYHYENLSDTNGDMEAALLDFEKNLNRFREVADIQTISMHGSALKGIDNRDLWKANENLLQEKFNISGEVYLQIDYSDICYINDTGRNWTSSKANVRDKVHSNIPADFSSGTELGKYLEGKPHPKLIFQIHPERVSPTSLDLVVDWCRDKAINTAKVLFAIRRM